MQSRWLVEGQITSASQPPVKEPGLIHRKPSPANSENRREQKICWTKNLGESARKDMLAQPDAFSIRTLPSPHLNHQLNHKRSSQQSTNPQNQNTMKTIEILSDQSSKSTTKQRHVEGVRETTASQSQFRSGLKNAGIGFAAAIQSIESNLPSGAAVGFMAAVLVGGSINGKAAVMLAPDTTLPGQAYIDAGQAYAGYMVAIKRISSSGIVSYASGIKLSPYQVLLPAHVIDSLSGFRPPERLAVLGGADFYSPDYTLLVESYVSHPSYVSGSNSVGGSIYDMAIITTTVPLPGNYATLATGPIPNGVIITYAGYGMPGLSAATATTYDGALRAFQGIATDPISLFDNSIYGATYASSSLGLSLPGSGSTGDSGAGGFISANQVGFMVTSGSGDNSTFGIDLTTDEARSFIFTNIPEPSGAALILAAFASALLIRNRNEDC